MPHGHTYHSMHFESMNKPHKTVSLSADQRLALEALCRRRKVEALVWKRARAFLLLDAGYDTKLVCEILDIGPTVLTEWQFAFSGAGLSFLGLKDYSQRQGHLSVTHERLENTRSQGMRKWAYQRSLSASLPFILRFLIVALWQPLRFGAACAG